MPSEGADALRDSLLKWASINTLEFYKMGRKGYAVETLHASDNKHSNKDIAYGRGGPIRGKICRLRWGSTRVVHLHKQLNTQWGNRSTVAVGEKQRSLLTEEEMKEHERWARALKPHTHFVAWMASHLVQESATWRAPSKRKST